MQKWEAVLWRDSSMFVLLSHHQCHQRRRWDKTHMRLLIAPSTHSRTWETNIASTAIHIYVYTQQYFSVYIHICNFPQQVTERQLGQVTGQADKNRKTLKSIKTWKWGFHVWGFDTQSGLKRQLSCYRIKLVTCHVEKFISASTTCNNIP